MKMFPNKVSLTRYAIVLSIFTTLAFHIPFFKHLFAQLEGGANAVLITVGAFLLLAGLNFLLYWILVWAGRFVGKCVVSFTLIGDAITLYFINDYEVLVTDEMMGNVFNTQMSEAGGFFSIGFVLYVLLLGVLPSVYVFARKVDYGSWKRFLAGIGAALGVVAAAAFGNIKNWPWIDRNATELGSLLMPWSYIVNSFRYWDAEKQRNRKEILLPDGVWADDDPAVCVLVIGESARSDHFSYFGYPRETNPFTKADSLRAFPAISSATFTIAGVKAILEPVESAELYEILPNYLYRSGADVSWRTSNWGEPPCHFPRYYHIEDLQKRDPEADPSFDGILLAGLGEDILSSTAAKQLVVIHTNTNHGPSYNNKYPAEFEHFTPVCNTVEMAKTSQQELFNAYDNSIVYTDYLLHSVIETLRSFPGRSCMIYVSDHGESLGENNLYMHGVPYSMAPREQLEIPFLVWTSDSSYKVKDLPQASQHHVFHSVIYFLGLGSDAFDENKNIFEKQ
ncbi:MAG: DUF1705 domain-containing protein [Bacteroidales bacterium]|nr:DUF1705 domain-containing protein [Bacteroidales bacterium]